MKHYNTCLGLVNSFYSTDIFLTTKQKDKKAVDIHDTCQTLFLSDEAEITKQIQDVGANMENIEPFLLKCSGDLTLTFFKLVTSRIFVFNDLRQYSKKIIFFKH